MVVFLFFSLNNASINRRETRHVTIEFNQKPKDSRQRLDWTEGVKGAIKSVNQDLRKDGFLIPEVHPIPFEASDSWWIGLYKYFTNLYYEVFFHKEAIAYRGKKK